MGHSYANRTEVTCPSCGKTFVTDVWLLVDAAERPDLLERARRGTIWSIHCPDCGRAVGQSGAPLLLFRPGETPPLIFSPSSGANYEEAEQQAQALVGLLRSRLGDQWQESWQENGFQLARSDQIPALLGQAPPAAPPRTPPKIPDELKASMQYLIVLTREAQHDPGLHQNRAQLMEHMLQQFDPDRHAALRSELLHNLGNAYRQVPTGDRTANLALAIARLQEALRFRTPERSPSQYANTQNSLGSAYAELPKGNRDAQLRQAIACFEEALRFWSPDAEPLRYALAQHNRGDAYRVLTTGDRTDNLKRAIDCFEEALHFRTAEAVPMDYALTQNNLGAAYLELPTGNRADNLQKAFACFHEALRFRTRQSAPFEYALTQHNLGTLYYSLTTGDPTANLQQAIACFEEALTIFTPEAAPLRYAMTQNSLGEALRNLPTGDPDANLARAIACFKQALRFHTLEAAPLDYARAQNNLGSAYSTLPGGDRAGNLRQAVACYQEALRILTPETAPLDYARIQNNLGLVFRELPTGDRVENLVRAIDCHQEALVIYTPEAAPLDYANTQNSLGNAYLELPTGQRTANLLRAIDCFGEALRFCTLEATPFDYAGTQNNLGAAYVQLRTGDRAANLEKAIACFREALVVMTPQTVPFDYARLQNNLGNAYAELPSGDRAANLQQAVDCFQEALTIYTAEAAPLYYAMTQLNLGTVFADLPTGDRETNLQQAITCYERALAIYTPETAPADHRGTAGNLGNLYFGQGRWREAHTAYASALAAGENLYQFAATEAARQTELAWATELVSNDAYCLARCGSFSEAVERLEASRTRALVESLARDRAALERATADDRQAFEAARDRIRALQAEARSLGVSGAHPPVSRSFVQISSDLRAARQELAEVIDRIWAYVPEFMPSGLDYAAITASAEPGRPLVYLIVTMQGSLAFIVSPGADSLDAEHVVWLPDFKRTDLDLLLSQKDAVGKTGAAYLLGQVKGDRSLLETALDQGLATLGKLLMGPLAVRLADLGYEKVTLIPTGRLSLLPLHAAVCAHGNGPRIFLEDFDVAFAPSARALASCRRVVQADAGQPARLLAVADPPHNGAPRLAFASSELAEVVPLFPTGAGQVLDGQNATRDRVLEAVSGYSYLHFACHGRFDLLEPLNSALLLANADRLTLRDLLDRADLTGLRLVVLSACQTAITDFYRVPDEAVGLPAGFLQAGASAVVSTLWPVEDLSTSLLIGRFYHEHLEEGLQPSQALRAAQNSLRKDVDRPCVIAYIKSLLPNLKSQRMQASPWSEEQAAIDRQLSQIKVRLRHFREQEKHDPGGKPFEHPFYWAAFTISGADG